MIHFSRALGVVVLSASLVGVAACSTGADDDTSVEAVPSDVASSTAERAEESVTTTDQFADRTITTSGVIPGEVGKLHAADCTDPANCSVYFTIEKLDIVPECPGEGSWEPVEGQELLEFQALVDVSAEPVTPGYNAENFGRISDWSALTEEGINVPIEGDTMCMAQTDARQAWHEQVHPGDKQRAHQYFSIPADTVKLRLTESNTRWEFDLSNRS